MITRWFRNMRIREQTRISGWAWLGHLVHDLRFAARALRRTPGFTLVTVASLALGLAVTASTLTVVNAYLLRSLPYPASDRLYAVMYAPPGPNEPHGMTAIDWTTLNDVVEHTATSAGDSLYLMDRGYAEQMRGTRASAGFLESLGIRAAIGRSFLAEEFRKGAEPVVMISDHMWRERFGADPAIVGRPLRAYTEGPAGLVERPLRIVGVMPPVFWYRASGDSPDFVTPVIVPTRTYMVRLRDGVPVAHAERRITEAAKSVATWIPPNWTGVHLESVHERYVASLRPVLVAITAAASLVLVIVCANVAVLMSLRTMRRQREIGVRLALGAGRSHIVRMLAAEASLLCVVAVAAGLALTAFALRLATPFIETHFERPAPGGLALATVDPTVPLVIGIIGVLIAVSLSFIPLLPGWQHRLGDALRREGRTGTDSRSMRRLQIALMVFEVAGSLALLVGCGLMIRSVVNLVRSDLGWETSRVVYAHLVLPRGLAAPPAMLAFYDRLFERLSAAASPSVAIADLIPFVETRTQTVQSAANDAANATAGVLAVGDSYFDTLGIEIPHGRGITPEDRMESEPVVVVSEALARRMWPNQPALGQRLRVVPAPPAGPAAQEPPAAPWRTVVGVARNVRQTYTDDDLYDVYIPFAQAPSRFASLYVRTDRPAAWLTEVRRTIAEISPFVNMNAENLLADEDRQLAGARVVTSMMTGFAVFAVLLALLGIYGVTAYAVQQREREVAIRMALGATGRSVVRMFLKEGGLVLAAGLVCGLIAARPLGRLLQHQIYGVRPSDAVTLASTCALLTIAALVATWWPARRAAARNPSVSLNES